MEVYGKIGTGPGLRLNILQKNLPKLGDWVLARKLPKEHHEGEPPIRLRCWKINESVYFFEL